MAMEVCRMPCAVRSAKTVPRLVKVGNESKGPITERRGSPFDSGYRVPREVQEKSKRSRFRFFPWRASPSPRAGKFGASACFVSGRADHAYREARLFLCTRNTQNRRETGDPQARTSLDTPDADVSTRTSLHCAFVISSAPTTYPVMFAGLYIVASA